MTLSPTTPSCPKRELVLSEDQVLAIDGVSAWLQQRHKEGHKQTLSLGGYAGTGKTTVVREILAQARGIDIGVCALTGKAAHELHKKGVTGAQTLDRLIYKSKPYCRSCRQNIPAFSECPKCGSRRHAGFRRLRYLEIAPDVVIVDEASMLNEQYVDDLLKFKKPVLFVGDHGQLEPIGNDPRVMLTPDIRLKQIHRQVEGSPIIDFAHHLRTRRSPVAWSNAGVVAVHRSPDSFDPAAYDMVLCGRHKSRVAFNRMIRQSRGFEGPDPQPREKLLCYRNDPELGVLNGQLMTVVRVRHSAARRLRLDMVDEDGGEYPNTPISRARLHSLEPRSGGGGKLGMFGYGYAMTVHKAQGSEWGRVAVFEEIMSDWTAARWRYTAATRAARHLDWYMSLPRFPAVIEDPEPQLTLEEARSRGGRKDPNPFEPVEVDHEGEMHDTGYAVLLELQSAYEGEVWIPTSQIVKRYDYSVIIPRWLAEDRDLDYSPRPDLWPDRPPR